MTQLLVQRFHVPLEYPVYFTREVFAAQNSALCDAICRKDPGRKQRCLFVVEDRVAELWPQLLTGIQAYVLAHADRLTLAGETLVIPGAEACKTIRTRLDACTPSSRRRGWTVTARS